MNKLGGVADPADQAQALARLAARSMQWQVTVQDGHVWVNSGEASLELRPQLLMGPAYHRRADDPAASCAGWLLARLP